MEGFAARFSDLFSGNKKKVLDIRYIFLQSGVFLFFSYLRKVPLFWGRLKGVALLLLGKPITLLHNSLRFGSVLPFFFSAAFGTYIFLFVCSIFLRNFTAYTLPDSFSMLYRYCQKLLQRRLLLEATFKNIPILLRRDG